MAHISTNTSISVLKIKEFLGLNENPDGEDELESAAVDYDEEMTGGDMTDDYMAYGGD